MDLAIALRLARASFRMSSCDPSGPVHPDALFSGPYSLWAPHELSVDAEITQMAASRNKPLDLMNLPFDPAQAAMRACEKRQTGK
jgi:hypothetical protein